MSIRANPGTLAFISFSFCVMGFFLPAQEAAANSLKSQIQTLLAKNSSISNTGGKNIFVSAARTLIPRADGKSWLTAYRDFSNIDWSKVNPGDRIVIDGGIGRLVYAGGLKVQKNGLPDKPIIICSSNERFHDGQVIFNGANSRHSIGIDLSSCQNVQVIGRPIKLGKIPSKSIRISSFPKSGINIGYSSYAVKLKDIEIDNNGGAFNMQNPQGSGIKANSSYCELSKLFIHNNNVNVDTTLPDNGKLYFNKCWIYNTPDSSNRCYYADGVKIRDGASGYNHGFAFKECILGPGLSTGVEFSQTQSGLSMSDCLFINPRLANIVKTHETEPEATSCLITLFRITSFLTPLNNEFKAHSCLDFAQGTYFPPTSVFRLDSCYNSIFYGGTVAVRRSRQKLGEANFQFKTTGNTLALSVKQTDPLFRTNVESLTSMNIQALLAADYGLRHGSPAMGSGSQIGSIQKLISME